MVGVMVGSGGRVLVGIGVKVAAAVMGVGARVEVGGNIVGTRATSVVAVVGRAVIAVGVGSVCWQPTAKRIINATQEINLIFIFGSPSFVNLSSKRII